MSFPRGQEHDEESRAQQYWEQRGGVGPHPWPKRVITVSELDKATEEEWNSLSRQVGGNHYKNLAIQPIEYIMANDMKYCAANIVKYATRAEHKNGVEDIEKIIHYAQLWLENFR